MASSKISALTTVTTPALDDPVPVVVDAGATPVPTTQKALLSDVMDYLDPKEIHHRAGPHEFDDEFDDDDASAWTVVEDTSPNIEVMESRGALIVGHEGGDSSWELHGLVRAKVPAGSFRLEAAFRGNVRYNERLYAGLAASDGATWGSTSNQVSCLGVLNGREDVGCQVYRHSDWNTYEDSGGSTNFLFHSGEYLFQRLEYNSGTNVWTSSISIDGVSWNYEETITYSMTPTHLGFVFWDNNSGSYTKSLIEVQYFRYDDI